LRASSQLLPIRVQIRIERELKNAACGKTLSFFGQLYGTQALRTKARSKFIASDQPPLTDEMILQQLGAPPCCAGNNCHPRLSRRSSIRRMT
jgi:hypothetical protein